jgi:competence protein ComEC
MISAQLGMIPILVRLSAKQSPALMMISISGTMLSQGICTLAIPISAMYFALSVIILDNTVFRTLFLPVRGLIYLLDRITRIGEIDFIDALRMETITPFLLLGIFGLTLLAVLKSSTFKKCLFGLTIVILMIGIATQIFSYVNRPIATIVFFDVGQGDSALIMSNGKSVLIDGGEGEMCSRVLIPALNYYGIRKVDVVLMSHLHSDHGGGLLELLSENRAEDIGVPFFGEGEDYDKLMEGYEVDDKLYLLKSGDSIRISKTASLNILHPAEPECAGGNEDSLVIMFTVSGTGVLFMGDSGFPTEEELMSDIEIRSFLFDNTDIMKVGHHGSKYSTSEEFLSRIDPEAAIISVGNNFYGHPTVETISRLNDSEADVFRTDINGAVILEIYEDQTLLRTMLGYGEET